MIFYHHFFPLDCFFSNQKQRSYELINCHASSTDSPIFQMEVASNQNHAFWLLWLGPLSSGQTPCLLSGFGAKKKRGSDRTYAR